MFLFKMQNLTMIYFSIMNDISVLLMLQYKNVRPDYLKNIWKVINWKYASQVYGKECP